MPFKPYISHSTHPQHNIVPHSSQHTRTHTHTHHTHTHTPSQVPYKNSNHTALQCSNKRWEEATLWAPGTHEVGGERVTGPDTSPENLPGSSLGPCWTPWRPPSSAAPGAKRAPGRETAPPAAVAAAAAAAGRRGAGGRAGGRAGGPAGGAAREARRSCTR